MRKGDERYRNILTNPSFTEPLSLSLKEKSLKESLLTSKTMMSHA